MRGKPARPVREGATGSRTSTTLAPRPVAYLAAWAGYRPDFPINQVWLELALTVADLIAWTQTTLLDGDLAKAEPKTLRYRLRHVAARLTCGPGQDGRCTDARPGDGRSLELQALGGQHVILDPSGGDPAETAHPHGAYATSPLSQTDSKGEPHDVCG